MDQRKRRKGGRKGSYGIGREGRLTGLAGEEDHAPDGLAQEGELGSALLNRIKVDGVGAADGRVGGRQSSLFHERDREGIKRRIPDAAQIEATTMETVREQLCQPRGKRG